jgi:hypothetical protein
VERSALRGSRLGADSVSMPILCYACREPLEDDQPSERVFSAQQPYRHSDPDHCPVLREQLAVKAERDRQRQQRHLKAV